MIRCWNLSKNPFGFFCDEASIGYNAYSIFKTGKDEYGEFLPIFFKSFGDYRPPLAIYAAIPFIAILGLNEFSARIVSVFFGVLTVVVVYFIGKEIKSKSTGFWSALAAAIMPWLIHYNRTGFEFTIYSFFFTVAVFFFLKSFNNKKFLIPAFIWSGLALYTYQPARLLVPLLLFGVLLINWKSTLKHIRENIFGFLTFLIIGYPLLAIFLTGEAFARFNMVSVFSANLTFREIIFEVFNNYLVQLSPAYFLKGEPTFINRHFIGGLAPLLSVIFIFSIIGLIYIFLTFKQKSSKLLFWWLLIYPVAGAVTSDGPFTSRSIIGASLFAIMAGSGIEIIINLFKSKTFRAVFSTVIIVILWINFNYFVNFYFSKYPLYSSDYWGWQYGPKEIINYFISESKNYDELFMAGTFNAPEIFLKFYDPEKKCPNCYIGGQERIDRGKKQLFAITGEEFDQIKQKAYIIKKIIYYPSGKKAFVIFQFT